ncbi:MAG TPA: DUF417 family protein [Streptosporangiaceae bacterium]|nr:DUF417 family protein [Streptosporangiaceae bacterium]
MDPHGPVAATQGAGDGHTTHASEQPAPRASAAGSIGAVGMMLSTLSFLATTPEAWTKGPGGIPQPSMLGEALLKDTVLLGAALLTAAESLRAADDGSTS